MYFWLALRSFSSHGDLSLAMVGHKITFSPGLVLSWNCPLKESYNISVACQRENWQEPWRSCNAHLGTVFSDFYMMSRHWLLISLKLSPKLELLRLCSCLCCGQQFKLQFCILVVFPFLCQFPWHFFPQPKWRNMTGFSSQLSGPRQQIWLTSLL